MNSPAAYMPMLTTKGFT